MLCYAGLSKDTLNELPFKLTIMAPSAEEIDIRKYISPSLFDKEINAVYEKGIVDT